MNYVCFSILIHEHMVFKHWMILKRCLLQNGIAYVWHNLLYAFKICICIFASSNDICFCLYALIIALSSDTCACSNDIMPKLFHAIYYISICTFVEFNIIFNRHSLFIVPKSILINPIITWTSLFKYFFFWLIIKNKNSSVKTS